MRSREGELERDDGAAALSGDDFAGLAALWSSVPSDEDAAALDAAAQGTPSRARRAMAGELVLAGALAVAVALTMIVRPGPVTLLLGGILLALFGWSALRRHQLGKQALLIERASHATYLCSSVAAKRAELKRSALGLALMLPGTVITILFLDAVRSESDGDLIGFLLAFAVSAKGVVTIILMTLAMMILFIAHRRVARELAALEVLAAEYAAEERHERLAHS